MAISVKFAKLNQKFQRLNLKGLLLFVDNMTAKELPPSARNATAISVLIVNLITLTMLREILKML
jgi:transcriptional regulatory protein LevR